MVNAARVLDTLKQCVRRGIPYAVVMTSGSRSRRRSCRRLEREIAELCRDTGLHVYGPNCPGFVNVRDRIGMTFSPAFKDDLNSGGIGLPRRAEGWPQPAARPVPWRRRGAVVLRRQRGRPGDSGFRRPHGGRSPDPRDRAADGRREGRPPPDRRPAAGARARQARGGAEGRRSEAGVRAAQSHTASVAGTAAVNSAVFRQFGAIEVDDLDQLLAVSQLLTRASAKSGNGLCIYTFQAAPPRWPPTWPARRACRWPDWRPPRKPPWPRCCRISPASAIRWTPPPTSCAIRKPRPNACASYAPIPRSARCCIRFRWTMAPSRTRWPNPSSRWPRGRTP